MSVLIVDDSRSSLAALKVAVRQFTDQEIETFLDPIEALSRTRQVTFDLVLVDYMMPGMDGVEFTEKLRAQKAYEGVSVVMITSQTEREIRLQALRAGATDFLNKPFDAMELKARVCNLLALREAQLELADRAKSLDRAFKHAAKQADIREQEIVWCLAEAMSRRDGSTGDHVGRVAKVAQLIAEGVGLDRIHCRNIYLAAPLHDIGKIGIPDAILQKPGKLTHDEIEQMRQHVPIGIDILRSSSAEIARTATAIIAGHHEKWNGSGYPLGLAGDAIPIEARVVSVADVFDALCSERPYKRAWSLDESYDEIIACSGSHFDPACVAAFRLRWPEIKALFDQQDESDFIDETPAPLKSSAAL